MVYRFFRWRKAMGVSYQEMLETDISVILTDLDILDLEDSYS